MKKIVGILRPFSLEQTLYVYNGEAFVKTEDVTIDEVANAVSILANEYDINDVYLRGAKQYSLKVKEDIKEKAITYYNRTLNITIE